MAACLLVIITYLACSGAIMPAKTAKTENNNTIVIDAGHGASTLEKSALMKQRKKISTLPLPNG